MSRRKSRGTHEHATRVVLDSGGLTALAGGSREARERLRWVTMQEGDIIVPTPILVECITGDGARDAEINRILGVLQRSEAVLEAPGEELARRAGKLRFEAEGDDGIDALVAASAVGDGSPAVLLTSDPDDLERLLEHEKRVHVRRV